MKEEIGMALLRARVPIMSFPAIMVLVWVYLMNIQLYLNVSASRGIIGSFAAYIPLVCDMLYFLIGLLTDVYIGRYRAIMIGIVLCFISWITTGILFILNSYGYLGKIWIDPGVIINYIGVIVFSANIIQYNIDQLIGASANELSTIIYWNIAAMPVANIISDWLRLTSTATAEFTYIIVIGVALSLILVSHSLFKDKLENISLIKNPIKLIVGVLRYARKHKYPENRSALTYWEEEAPSRLDLGKDKYGGPFTEEEVEDVKTFFRMLPLFIAIFGFGLISFTFRGDCNKESLVDCEMITLYDIFSITIVLLFFIYQFIIRRCFHKYIPSMLTKMGTGLFFALCGCIVQLLMKIYALYYSLLIIQQILLGISFFLILPTSFEFTVAQSPEYMRGMMVGLCYTSLAVGDAFVSVLLQSSFKNDLHYYSILCFLQLLILIMFVILARRYKYRVRENEVNIVQIVDDHYQRYMEQEDEYEKHQESLENEIIIED
uniref:Major facilitator superfamily (MFS) profile domain-containing protein n=1 Tax=Amphimedon queenslandica TaxID=400682 RepID=A0A1X7TQB5_AMPQE